MFGQTSSKPGTDPTPPSPCTPEFVLFGDSLTEWSFDNSTQGFGLFLSQQYTQKAHIVNEALCLIPNNHFHVGKTAIEQVMTLASEQVPEFVLFGASMTEWSFKPTTQGPGWFLETQYEGKVRVVNEGKAGYTSIRLRLDFERIIRRATSPNAAPTLLFTIFIGANDACFVGQDELVPWPTFSTNIRYFIDTILKKNALAQTKIVLITPPPIDGATSTPLNGSETQEDIDAINAQKKEGVRYKTYMSKKRYAEGLMGIADEYAKTGRVVGLNYWRGMVEASGLGTWEEWEESGLWPGSMLVGAKGFEKGWFTDGLHLDRKGYTVLNKMLMEAIEEKWPELAPEKLENV